MGVAFEDGAPLPDAEREANAAVDARGPPVLLPTAEARGAVVLTAGAADAVDSLTTRRPGGTVFAGLLAAFALVPAGLVVPAPAAERVFAGPAGASAFVPLFACSRLTVPLPALTGSVPMLLA